MKYIYKITPNNKTVVINSDVLINGYDDIHYTKLQPTYEEDEFALDDIVIRPDSPNNPVLDDDLVYPVNATFKITSITDFPWTGGEFITPISENLNMLDFKDKGYVYDFTYDLYDDNTLIKGSYKYVYLSSDEPNKLQYCSFTFEFSTNWSDKKQHELSLNSLKLDGPTFKYFSDDPLRNENLKTLYNIDSTRLTIRHLTGYKFSVYATYVDPNTTYSITGFDLVDIYQSAYTLPANRRVVDVSGIYPVPIASWTPYIFFKDVQKTPINYYDDYIYQIQNVTIQSEINSDIWTYTSDKYIKDYELNFAGACDETGNITNKVLLKKLIITQSDIDGSQLEYKDFCDAIDPTHQYIYTNETYANDLYYNTSVIYDLDGKEQVSISIQFKKEFNVGYNSLTSYILDENNLIIDISTMKPADVSNIFAIIKDNDGNDEVAPYLTLKKPLPTIDIKMYYEGHTVQYAWNLSYNDLVNLYNTLFFDYMYNGTTMTYSANNTKSKRTSKKVKEQPYYNFDMYGSSYDHTITHNNNYELVISPGNLNNIENDKEFTKFISNNLRINGVKVNDIVDIQNYFDINITSENEVYPGIYTISVDNMDTNISGELTVNLSGLDGVLMFTNDENLKNLTTYPNVAKDINTPIESYMLLRTNPKLTGNIKLVVDSNDNLYLDTFNISPELNKKQYRKYPVSYAGNYPGDVKTVFGNIPLKELFKVPEMSLDAHRFYSNFEDLYLTLYEYGAETNDNNMYSENMRIFAPLHIGKHIPEFFAIFRYDGTYNDETYKNIYFDNTEKFKSILANSIIVKTIDLRTFTAIGQYLNNYKDMLLDYISGQLSLQFIEQDNPENSSYYRQGMNNWKGISIDKGVLTYKSEFSYFITKELNQHKDNIQETLNDYIINGFERNNILYPNILNLEFMFDDNDTDNYSMHRYFGLYLTENDIVNYDCIITNDPDKNDKVTKYDVSNNIITSDKAIIDAINSDMYNDRIFYAVTNDCATRVKNNMDINTFLNNNVINSPMLCVHNTYANEITLDPEKILSFITLTFTQPIQYGEHLKFVALNKIDDSVNITSAHNSSLFKKRHIVFEIIGSNNPELIISDNYINPYVSTLKDEYSENTEFYRITMYTLDKNNPIKSASIKEQIYRIKCCIEKFNSFISVGSYNDDTISILSSYDEMYFQHIDRPNLDELYYEYTDDTEIANIKNYTLINDGSTYVEDNNGTINKTYYQYVNYENPINIKEDSILYFTTTKKSLMHALSNESRYFDPYYSAFANYQFETLGWRYQNIIKFVKTNDLSYTYSVYKNIEESLKDILHPLIYGVNNKYNTLSMFNISSGYVNCKTYLNSSIKQQLNLNDTLYTSIIDPFNVNNNIINSVVRINMNNNNISLYKPKWATLAVMGISNIKDLDTTVNIDRTIDLHTALEVSFIESEKIKIDESDYRLQHGVVYQLLCGGFDGIDLDTNDKFIIIGNTVYTSKNESGIFVNNKELTTTGNITTIKILLRQKYQDFDVSTSIPTLFIHNFFSDENIETSKLNIPIVPSVNCLWQSNGTYLDQNSILDATLLEKSNITGAFTENIYTPAEFSTNLYVCNKIDSVVNIDGIGYTYEDAILNNRAEHIIKQMLINDTNIKPAIGYYNSTILTFEFIFNGAKFTMKLSDMYYQPKIHLNEYNNYEVFILNDYDMSKHNKVYISTVEEFILIINHNFYENYLHEAANNIICIDSEYNNIKHYADYSVITSPYNINFNSIISLGNIIAATKTTTDSVFNYIDPQNMWSSYIIQQNNYDDIYNNNATIFYNSLTTLQEFGNDLGFIHVEDADVLHKDLLYKTAINGIDTNKVKVVLFNSIVNTFKDSNAYTYIITKADGEYNYVEETNRLKLNRYAKSFDIETDYYVIEKNHYETLSVDAEHKYVLLNVTVPNRIKYNFGYFTPATRDIVEFNTFDDIKFEQIFNINSILANTSVKAVNNILTYTGNKVFSNNKDHVTSNYFIELNRSPLTTNWDKNYYREYTNENVYNGYDGYLTGIDDKAFFGSKCMTIKNGYLLIDEWNQDYTTNMIKLKEVDSTFNTHSINQNGTEITINIDLAIYNILLNNAAFNNNWENLSVNKNIAIKNYIDLTIKKFFNTSSKMELTLYKKDDYNISDINIVYNKPLDLLSENWSEYTNFESEYITINNETQLVIKLNDLSNIHIYPMLKIYKK